MFERWHPMDPKNNKDQPFAEAGTHRLKLGSTAMFER